MIILFLLTYLVFYLLCGLLSSSMIMCYTKAGDSTYGGAI